MNKILKYDQARYALFDLAVRNHLEVGDRFPSFRAMAQMFPFSPGCLRRALDELADQGILEKRHGSGIYLTRAIDLWEKEGSLLFLQIAPDAEMVPAAVADLRRYLHDRRFFLKTMAVDKPCGEVLEASRECLGIFASGFVTREWAEFLVSLGKPLLFVGRNAATEDKPTIGLDWKEAVRMAMDRLLSKGFRRIGLVDSDPSWYPSHVIAREYLAQVKAHRLPVGEEDILWLKWLDDRPVETFLRDRSPYDALLIEREGLCGFLLCSRRTSLASRTQLAVLGDVNCNLASDDVFFVGFEENIYLKAGVSFFQSLNNPEAFRKGPELLRPSFMP